MVTRHALNITSDWNLGQLMLLMLESDQSSAHDMGVQNHIFAVELDDFVFRQVFIIQGLYTPYLCTVFVITAE